MKVRKSRKSKTCSELLSLSTISVDDSVVMLNKELHSINKDLSAQLEKQKEVSAEFLKRAIRAEEALMDAEEKLGSTISAAEHERLKRAFVEMSTREASLKIKLAQAKEKISSMDPFILPTSLEDWDKCLNQLKVNLEDQKKEEYFG